MLIKKITLLVILGTAAGCGGSGGGSGTGGSSETVPGEPGGSGEKDETNPPQVPQVPPQIPRIPPQDPQIPSSDPDNGGGDEDSGSLIFPDTESGRGDLSLESLQKSFPSLVANGKDLCESFLTNVAKYRLTDHHFIGSSKEFLPEIAGARVVSFKVTRGKAGSEKLVESMSCVFRKGSR